MSLCALCPRSTEACADKHVAVLERTKPQTSMTPFIWNRAILPVVVFGSISDFWKIIRRLPALLLKIWLACQMLKAVSMHL